jgi:hypothetical protein
VHWSLKWLGERNRIIFYCSTSINPSYTGVSLCVFKFRNDRLVVRLWLVEGQELHAGFSSEAIDRFSLLCNFYLTVINGQLEPQ